MKKSKKLRVAFIGCGGISGRHAAVLSADRRVEITHLVDTSSKSLKGFKERFPSLADLPECSDYREVLGDVDAVSINSPHTTHYQQIMDSLGRGLHVLCEKPLACTGLRAKKIVVKVKQTRRKLQIAYQRKAFAGFRLVHDLIKSGEIGRLQYISVIQCQQWKHITMGTWRQDPKLSGGGQINDSGSHLVDMLLFFANQKPTCVTAFCDNRGTKVDIDTTANVLFDKGAIASISVIGDAHQWHETWYIVGSKATLRIDGEALSRIDGPSGEPRPIPPPKKGVADITTNWVDAIFGKAKLMSPAKDVLGVVKLTEAIWNSAAAGGKPVKIK